MRPGVYVVRIIVDDNLLGFALFGLRAVRVPEDFSSDPKLNAHIARVLRVGMPTGTAISLLSAALRKWFKPRFTGLDRLPEQPALFVGNHALLALDAFTFHTLMHVDHRRFLRPLGDKTLFANKQYADAVIGLGAALGHPDVVRGLMAHEKDLLLYPGGTYEAVKSPEQRYALMWKQRLGFVRLAAEMGYTIVPFASVGPDEYYEQYLTGADVQQAQLTQLLMRVGVLPNDLRSDIVPPLPAGALGSLLPKPKATYFGFCEPVVLKEFTGQTLQDSALKEIRTRIESAIETEIKNLLLLRERQRHSDGPLRRLLNL